MLNSLGSPASRRVYEYAIDQFIAWYCSEPRLAFNRIVVVRYRMYLESRQLERSLTERRKDIYRKYDTRGSRLKDVLGRLLYEHRIGEDDLRGLGEEKIKSIRSFAQFLRDNAA